MIYTHPRAVEPLVTALKTREHPLAVVKVLEAAIEKIQAKMKLQPVNAVECMTAVASFTLNML